MRVDKFLKVSRIIKRRTVAGEACERQRVFVNGHPAKPGKDIKPGDTIDVHFGTNTLTIKVLSVAETVRKEEAGSMYEVIGETRRG